MAERGETVKLFVGQVPKDMSESELFAMFNQFAQVDEVHIIKDKVTRVSQGYCFVKCPSKEEAEKAINACHNKTTLRGASSPLQVKYAHGKLERPEHKLFVGMLPKNVSDDEVSALFSEYGTIKDLVVLRCSQSQQSSKGCAFLEFETEEQALAAIEALNGKHKMEGSTVPLVVEWPYKNKERQARRAQKAHVPNVDYTQHPSLFGALPMGYMLPYDGYGYQTPGTYGLMHYHCSPPLQNQHAWSFPGTYPAVPGVQHLMTYPRGPPGANLFVSGIPQEFGDDELGNAFQRFGRVLSATVIVDRATGVSKCFGFVSYDSPVAAENAINMMNGSRLGGKRLKVEHKRENKQNKPC